MVLELGMVYGAWHGLCLLNVLFGFLAWSRNLTWSFVAWNGLGTQYGLWLLDMVYGAQHCLGIWSLLKAM